MSDEKEVTAEEITALTEEQLRDAIDSTQADLALALKYPHNAPFRPKIVAWLERLNAERSRRGKGGFALDTEQLPYGRTKLYVVDTRTEPDDTVLVHVDPNYTLTAESRQRLGVLLVDAMAGLGFKPEYDTERQYL